MTVTADLPLPVTWQKPPIVRSNDHRYTYNDITHPGVTTVIDLLGATFEVASRWGANHAAEAAVRLIPELPKMLEAIGPEGVAKAIASRSAWGDDPSGSKLGTQVHELISNHLRGLSVRPMIPAEATRVAHFMKWWDASGWKLRLSEAMIVRPADEKAEGWGGTFDLLAYDRDGATVMADIKTGNLYAKVALQLAAYGMAPLVQPADAMQTYPMPLPDRYAVLHVTEKGCREVPIVVGTGERMAFLACLELFNWNATQKGKRL